MHSAGRPAEPHLAHEGGHAFGVGGARYLVRHAHPQAECARQRSLPGVRTSGPEERGATLVGQVRADEREFPAPAAHTHGRVDQAVWLHDGAVAVEPVPLGRPPSRLMALLHTLRRPGVLAGLRALVAPRSPLFRLHAPKAQ